MRHKPLKRKKRAPTLAGLKRKAWKLLSEVIRKQWACGGYVVCYTCGDAANWKDMQAGHAIPGRTGSVLLDEDIIRPQDAKCNIWGRGMYHVFTAKLIKENGMEWWEAKLQASRQVRKWTRTDLEVKIQDYRARLEALKTSI